MIVPSIAASLDGTVDPPRRPSRLGTNSLSSIRVTPMHRVRELHEALDLGDPSGALSAFEQALAAKDDALQPVRAKLPAGVSAVTRDEEAKRLTREHRAAGLREADRLYWRSRELLAEYGDEWVPTLRPILEESLGDLRSRAAEERFNLAYELHRELVRLRAVSTVSARWTPWAYLIRNMEAAYFWQLSNTPKLPNLVDLTGARRDRNRHEYDTRGFDVPRPDGFFTLARQRDEWGVSLYTAAEVIEHWREWPHPDRQEAPERPSTPARASYL